MNAIDKGTDVKNHPGDLSFRKVEFLLHDDGKTIEEEIDYLMQQDTYLGQKTQGGYLIAYFTDFASNLSYTDDGHPYWAAPGGENVHIGIAVHDEGNFNLVKGLKVTVSLTDEMGKPLGLAVHPFVRRPNSYHYGRNWLLPGDGKYSLHVQVETPPAMLCEDGSGKHNPGLVEVDFKRVEIRTGHKIS